METNTQRLLHTFAALADLGQEIADNADFEEMLRASFHLLLGSLAIRRGAVAEYDRERGQLRIAVMRGARPCAPLGQHGLSALVRGCDQRGGEVPR